MTAKTGQIKILTITPVDDAGQYKTGRLIHTVSESDINKILGFEPNISDDESKVTASWGFKVKFLDEDGNEHTELCGIWDYKRVRWSTYGTNTVMTALFGSQYCDSDF